jgi:hypothetical protein
MACAGSRANIEILLPGFHRCVAAIWGRCGRVQATERDVGLSIVIERTAQIPAYHSYRGVGILDKASRCFKELLCSDSRSSAAIGSFEQICSKAALQITQSSTEGRLTDVQYRRRLPKASMLGRDERPPQISKFDRQLLFSPGHFFQQ